MNEAAHPQSGATARAVHESAAAGATTATVRDRHTEKMSAKGPAEAATGAGLVMTAVEVATTGEEAEMIAPISATAHHNHQKAPVVALAAPSAALSNPQAALAPRLILLSRKRLLMWK